MLDRNLLFKGGPLKVIFSKLSETDMEALAAGIICLGLPFIIGLVVYYLIRKYLLKSSCCVTGGRKNADGEVEAPKLEIEITHKDPVEVK